MKTYLMLKRCATIAAFMSMFTVILTAQNGKGDQFEYRGNARVNTKTNITSAMYNINSRVYQGTPEEAARQFLNENKTEFSISDISDLKFIETIESPAGKHIGFQQTYNGIPVYGSETVVSLNKENRVSMVINGNTPVVALKNTIASIVKEVAVMNAIGKVKAEEATLVTQPKAELYIYQDSLGQFNLCWKISFVANNPVGDWQIFVDANSGDILKAMDISVHYVNGQGKVFRPDPVTALQNTSLTDQNNSDYSALQGAYVTATLNNLNDAIGGVYRLQGKYARSEDIESPSTTPVTSSTTSFLYNRSQSGFEETNVYYFLDAQRQYIGGLGFSPQWNGYDYIRFDAHGLSGADNSHYVPSSQYLAYGDGCIDDAEDQDVVLHEYAHALHDALMIGTGIGGTDEGRISEGSGDFLAVSYRKTLSTFQPNKVFPWDGISECWDGRLLNSTSVYPTQWSGLHDPAGVLWASTMMDIEGSGVGRNITNTLLLASFSYVAGSSTVLDHVNAIFQADRDIYNGIHLPTLATVFNNRGFFYNQTVSGTISSNTTWSGNKYVTGNLTVNSGTTLTLSPNTFLFFTNGTSLTANGVLSATGTSSQPITFTSMSGTSAGSWGSIILDESGASGSTLNYVTVQYGTEIEVNSVPNFTINHSTIQNIVNGVNAYNSSGWIMNSAITTPEDHGIVSNASTVSSYHNTITKSDHSGAGILYTAGSNDLIWDNDISGFNWGIGTSWGSIAYCGHQSNTGNNNSITDCYIGANVYQSGYAMFGEYMEYDQDYNSYYAGNLINNNMDYDVQTYTNSTVYAQGTNWGGGDPTYSVYDNSAFYYEDNLERLAENDKQIKKTKTLSSTSDLSGDHLGILPYIKLMKTYNDTTAESVINTLLSLDEKAPQTAKLFLANIYLKRGEIEKAKQVNNAISQANPNSALGSRAQLNNFYIALNKEKNNNAANILLNEIDLNAKFVEPTELALAWHDLNKNLKINSNNENRFVKKQSDQTHPQKYELLQNYPNPFNPKTTITFSLPQEGNVSLKVFDALGREVSTLLNGYRSAGKYNVDFNASNLSSGLYIYKLTSERFTEVKKMMLMK